MAAAGCGVVLAAGNGVALLCTALSCLIKPDGPGDIDDIETAWFFAAFGALVAFLTGLATLMVVRLVGARWLLVLGLLFILATARCSFIDAVYPQLPPD